MSKEPEAEYSVREVAKITGLSRDTVSMLIRRGRFPGSYRGGSGARNSPTRIPASAIEYYKATSPLAS